MQVPNACVAGAACLDGAVKLLPLLLALAGAAATASTLSAQAFEGRIKMSMKEGSSKPMTVEYAMKQDLVRMDIPVDGGMAASSIVNFPKKEIIMLMPEQQMYMVMPMQDVADASKAAAKDTVQLEKTNETETILGYTCTKYIARDRDGTTEIWAAEGIGLFAGLGSSNPMKPSPRNAWETELAEKGFFPLRVVGKTRAGRERFRMEAVSIDRQTLADSLFAVPAGYERFDMGGMMKGSLKGLIPGFGR